METNQVKSFRNSWFACLSNPEFQGLLPGPQFPGPSPVVTLDSYWVRIKSSLNNGKMRRLTDRKSRGQGLLARWMEQLGEVLEA